MDIASSYLEPRRVRSQSFHKSIAHRDWQPGSRQWCKLEKLPHSHFPPNATRLTQHNKSCLHPECSFAKRSMLLALYPSYLTFTDALNVSWVL